MRPERNQPVPQASAPTRTTTVPRGVAPTTPTTPRPNPVGSPTVFVWVTASDAEAYRFELFRRPGDLRRNRRRGARRSSPAVGVPLDRAAPGARDLPVDRTPARASRRRPSSRSGDRGEPVGPGRALADGAGDIGSTIYTRRMAAMEYEAVPAVDADAEATPLGTVVMKFGGTSVGDADRLKRVASRLVAAREEGHRVVGVLSAMGHTTDELLELARQISSTPHPRELDMLVSVGERISCALAAMVIHDLGHEAISFTARRPGSSPTRCTGRQRSSRFAPGGSTRRSTTGGSCSSPASRASPRPTRSPRSDAAAPTRQPSPSRRRWGHSTARSTRTCAASTPPTHGSSRSASAAARQLRRDARDGVLRCRRARHPLDRGRPQSQCAAPRALLLRGRRRDVDRGGGRGDARRP